MGPGQTRRPVDPDRLRQDLRDRQDPSVDQGPTPSRQALAFSHARILRRKQGEDRYQMDQRAADLQVQETQTSIAPTIEPIQPTSLEQTPTEEWKINIKKLVQVLISKNIISDKSEIE